MKKTIAIILSLLLTVLLVSCNSTNAPSTNTTDSPSNTADTPTNQNNTPKNEIVTLTKDNYQKYISAHIYSYGEGDSDHSYYCYNFIGSSLCKFNDVTISYSYDGGKTVKTCNLNLSGYGQTATASNSRYAKITIVDVSGTVEILY